MLHKKADGGVCEKIMGMYLYRVELGMPTVLDETETLVLKNKKHFSYGDFGELMNWAMRRTYEERAMFDYMLFHKLLYDMGFEVVEYAGEARVTLSVSSPCTVPQ